MTALILNVISGLSGRVQFNNIQENELNFLYGLCRACCSTCSHFEGRIGQCPADRKLWNRKTESQSSWCLSMWLQVSHLNVRLLHSQVVKDHKTTSCYILQIISLISCSSILKTKLSNTRSVSWVLPHPTYLCAMQHETKSVCFVSQRERSWHVMNVFCWTKSIHMQYFCKVCVMEEMMPELL